MHSEAVTGAVMTADSYFDGEVFLVSATGDIGDNDICMYLSDYSEQEWSLLVQLCEKLNAYRDGDRYSDAKMSQWLNG